LTLVNQKVTDKTGKLMPTRLLSLELQGYKTFATKNEFVFADEITAIVGPNGSGKSNVADAIRWVLGEQSFSLLRARKTDDMIFAGSERRSRSGMASATIVFNNETQWLPIDFSEVSLTRRAYRDGQNEYLINGSRVRLRDINELLAQSGLSERTYTVIGQGLVDSALSLRPEERRQFFEEAAGIQLYRSRQEESANRLATTRRNMDRVYDILNEIQPRLRSLERQARRVEDYERISADLQLLLREWYGYHWQLSQQEIQKAQQVYQYRETLVHEASKKQSMIEEEMNSLREEVRLLRDKLAELHGRSAALHEKREYESRQSAIFEERHKAIVALQNDLRLQTARIDEQEKSEKERLSGLLNDRDALSLEIEEIKRKVDLVQSELHTKNLQRSQLEARLRSSQQEADTQAKANLRLQAKINELQHRSEELTVSVEEVNQRIDKLERRNEENQHVMVMQAEKSTDLQSRLNDVEQMLAEQHKMQQEHEKAYSVKKQALTDMNLEHGRYEATLAYLDQSEAAYSGLSEGSAALLRAATSGKMKGTMRALSTVMDVPERYETAVSAVLGERVQTVLLDNDENIDDVRNYVGSEKKGRTVMGVSSLAATKKKALEKVQPGGQWLAGLVSYPEAYEPIFNAILGDVVLVENRKEAIAARKSDRDGFVVVTLAGEIFYPDGVIIAGGESTKTTIISRPRQKREINEKLRAINKQRKELDAVLDQLAKKSDHLSKVINGLEQDVAQWKTEIAALERQTYQLDLDQRRIKADIDSAVKQREQFIMRKKFTDEEITEIAQQVAQNEQNQAMLLEKVGELSEALAEISTSDLENDKSIWQTNLAVSNQALQAAENRMREVSELVAGMQSQKVNLTTRLDQYALEMDELLEQQQLITEHTQTIRLQIDEITEEITPAEKSLTEKEEKLTVLQKRYTIAQQNLTTAERNFTQAQLQLAREREKSDNLREKIEDDFGLVSFDAEQPLGGQEILPFMGVVKQLPVVKELPENLDDEIKRNRGLLRRLGAINPDAKKEFDEVNERHQFLSQQLEDLTSAEKDLQAIIDELNELMKIEFSKTFKQVAEEFSVYFTRLFAGGSARLEMTDEDNPTLSGIEIHAQLPGRREQNLALLSGGERSLTAVALVFALLKVSPTPFCILDEVDAMLDESNVGRFCDLLKELSASGTQFIVVTHNRGTVQAANIIYGVTKGTDSASHVVSLKLEEVSEDMIYA
jgi:chromosome segregation protein